MNTHHAPDGRFAPRPVWTALPMLFRPRKSAPHVTGHATRRTRWNAFRDARTAELVAYINGER